MPHSAGSIWSTFAGWAAVVLCVAGAGRAQRLQWGLPAGGAAEYRRRWDAHSDTATTAARAAELEVRGPVPERYLPALVPASVLCHGELDEDRQRPVVPPRDLRDVIRAVALDLSVRPGGRGNWRLHRVVPFGDLVLTGRVGRLDDTGWQELSLRVRCRRPAALAGDLRATREQVEPLCALPVKGELRLRRRLDLEAGLVREFEAQLALVVEEDRRLLRKLVVTDHWQLRAVLDGQDADFRVRVGRAVDRAAGWLRRTAADASRSYLQDGDDRDRSYGSGRVALTALTLLHAGAAADDPLVARLFATLRRRRLVDTYSLGTALMAMAQRYAPAGERELIRAGRLQARRLRQLDADDRELAARWLERLLANVDDSVDRGERARFTYSGGSWFDNSLTQYGLLGLDAAELCGLEVPAELWAGAAEHYLAVQTPAGGRSVALRLLDYGELAATAGGAAAGPEAAPRTLPARGFAYRFVDEPPYGGMTAAGAAGLVLARAGLLRAGVRGGRLRAVDDGIAQAFAWLGAELDLRSNPGFVGKANDHWYYWLYCLERACELASVARLQGRDWYYEGALQLLAQQHPSGAFRAERAGAMQLEATCFAVLFLQKATVAAVTGR